MKFIIFLAAVISLSSAWRWPWQRPNTPEWNKLSVTFSKFNGLPISKKDAEEHGWKLTSACGANPSFSGNRYVLNGDTAVMLLLDSKGKIAGIQAGIPVVKSQPREAPWVKEGNMYVITAYFVNPTTICLGTRPSSDYMGDRLLLQTGSSPDKHVAVPFKEEDLAGSKWVKGKCFYGMGQHYWFDISADMNCEDFFPMFILYNKKRLNAFGWALIGEQTSSRYEHPTWDKLDVSQKHVIGASVTQLVPGSILYFFAPGTKPQCLKNEKVLSTMHIYLDKRPYFNFC